jgi:putative nucleotidyltransferase with HDIG domain
MKRADMKKRSPSNRLRKLSLLIQLGRILNSTLDRQEVRKRALQAATQLMKAQAGSLLLLEGDSQRLHFDVALGEHEEVLKSMCLEVGEGIAGWVARSGKGVIVNSPDKDARFSARADGENGFRTRNVICVPLKVRNKTIGVLEALNKNGNKGFNRGDLSMFSSLADLVAIALDNARLYQELEEMFLETADSLSEAIEKRDPYTGGHTKRVTAYSLAVARRLHLGCDELKNVRIASVLHDIGKIGIEDKILRKREPLNAEELTIIKGHAMIGAEIMHPVRQLRGMIPGVKYHHEQVDGSGYPEGLTGDETPLVARIVAVADAYDAMTTDRPYRRALDKDRAVDELRKCSGTQLDGRVVDAFIEAYRNGEI